MPPRNRLPVPVALAVAAGLIASGTVAAVPSDLVSQGILQGLTPVGNDRLGVGVGLSGDGSRIATGAPGRDAGGTDRGAGALFSRSSGSWNFDQYIASSSGSNFDSLGECVAMSADGRVVAFGTPQDDTVAGADAGSVQVARDATGAASVGAATVWANTNLVLDPNGAAGDSFGCGLALSADGTTLAVASPFDNSSRGKVTVFTYGGGSYTRQAEMTRPSVAANDLFPLLVALSGDGSTLAGAAGHAGFTGANVFSRSGASWASQQAFSDNTTTLFGRSIALSADGNTLLVASNGPMSVFRRAGASWTAGTGITSIAPDTGAVTFVGPPESVAISGDGRVAAVTTSANVGGVTQAGRVHTFDLTSGTPVALQHFTPATAAVNDQWGGGGVALSCDGSTLAFGAPNADLGGLLSTGKVAVYASPASAAPGGGSGPCSSTGGGNGNSTGGGSTGGSPAGSGGGAPASAGAAVPGRPRVAWTYTAKTRRLVATVTPVVGVSYRESASKGKASRTGACRNAMIAAKGSKSKKTKKVAVVRCTITLPKGRWQVKVVPYAGSVAGIAAVRTIR